MLRRASEHIFALTLFSCLNCHIAEVEGHLPWLDLGCAFGMALATAQLSRVGGNTTVTASVTLMCLRWLSSVVGVMLTPNASLGVKKLALCVQLVSFCTLVLLG